MGSYTCIVACIIDIVLDMGYYLLFAKQISERDVSNRHKKKSWKNRNNIRLFFCLTISHMCLGL